MVFYEAPHKLLATLEDMAAVFGSERRISLCRELTKLHEEVLRTTLGKPPSCTVRRPPKASLFWSWQVQRRRAPPPVPWKKPPGGPRH